MVKVNSEIKDMEKFKKTILLAAFLVIFATRLVPYLRGQAGVEWIPPLFNRAALLIQDEFVRSQLSLTKEQIPMLDRLCETLDPLLFAMRDVTPDTADKGAIALAAQITEKLRVLDTILESLQHQRLEQLCWQYEGFGTLLYPHLQSRLKLTAEQMQQIRQIHAKSVAQQQEVMKQKSTGDTGIVHRQIQDIQLQEANQIFHVMSTTQQQQWQAAMGQPFDFSQVRPLSFRAPELKNVTEWINTSPVSMEDLQGRVVVVHFWTFGCSNCIQNYPVYKQWTKQYDPNEVLVLGIHTPESDYEKDPAALRTRIKQEGLNFAVAVDNDKANWKAWSNRIWPSVYLVDKKGKVRYWWYGELRWQGATGDQWLTRCIEELKAEQ